MKKYLLFASAILAFASCADNSYLGTADDQLLVNGDRPITFGFDVPTATRADNEGAVAAEKLNNQFIVFGEKNEDQSAAGTAPADGNLVFQNYQVNYGTSTAYTTTSNTKDWEYVGYTHTSAYQTKITTSTTDVQTIKYWDYGATNYVFTAVSALPADITNGRVSITKVTTGTTVYDKGYTVTLAKDASDNYPSLADLYFADRNVIAKGTGTDRNATNAYGGNATMKFRNSLSKVRVGMYETIPGYTVSAISFKVTNDGAAVDDSSNPAFGAICPNVKTDNFEGTINVTYYDNTDTDIENHPKLTIVPASGLANDDLILGTNINAISTSSPLSESVATPTYDTSTGTYTSVLPQIGNTTNLKLKVNYTLYNSITKEVITVENATAEIPYHYLQWKPNFMYTYLFKISPNTNGNTGTGSDPAGLYPITFDAVEVIAEDGLAEYITTVSEPTITTFGVNSSTGKYVTDGEDYAVGSDIYATFTEGSTVKTPVLGTSGAQHVNIFAVSSSDATNFPVTEASVAEAIANPASITNSVYTFNGTDTYTQVTDATTLTAGTTYYKADANSVAPGGSGYVQTLAVAGVDYQVAPKITATNINSDTSTYFTAAPAVVAAVPGEDGKDITIAAVKLTGVKAGTYAIEYEASNAWTGSYKKVYKVIVVQ